MVASLCSISCVWVSFRDTNLSVVAVVGPRRTVLELFIFQTRSGRVDHVASRMFWTALCQFYVPHRSQEHPANQEKTQCKWEGEGGEGTTCDNSAEKVLAANIIIGGIYNCQLETEARLSFVLLSSSLHSQFQLHPATTVSSGQFPPGLGHSGPLLGPKVLEYQGPGLDRDRVRAQETAAPEPFKFYH
ncbi:hypothetical protein FA15DRAFT_150507 [Coprinopsis marcescibilis]|uniref:Uncharacterized protein n=1 Tax=Coprinopsis marcescibilis TaxID=230819 RepID=A0A5C3KIL9_COPMA|nr:hypothetical protein FA15DRAFT_150507 [Coprinopsis marcescibilis]